MANEVLTSTRWAANTRIQLCNVPWDQSYRDVVAWDSAEDKDNWFLKNSDASKSYVNDHARYIRPSEPINVPIPYSTAYKYNYLVVTNPTQPVDYEGAKKTYYYFITKTEYASPQVTRLTLQLDVMTTYGTDVRFGNMYVDSGHVAIANAKTKNITASTTGELYREYLTQPEGLDVGAEYVIRKQDYFSFLDSNAYVLIVSTADLTVDPGTVDNPVLKTGNGQDWVGDLPSAACVYAMNIKDVEKLFISSQTYSWVAQCITSIIPFPAALLNTATKTTKTLFGKGQVNLYTKFRDMPFSDYGLRKSVFGTFRDVWQELLGTSFNLHKLVTYPYSAVEITAFNGGSVFLKPQLMNMGAFRAQVCATPGVGRIVVYPKNYNGTDESVNYKNIDWVQGTLADGALPSGDYLDSALVIDGFPTFPLVNNTYMTYLASTAHGRAYNYESAGWSNAKSLAASQLSYDQTQASMATASANQQLSQDLAAKQRDYSAVNAGIGVVGNLLTGNIGGALSGAASGVMQYDLANSQMATSQQQFTNQQNLQGQIADQNLAYAQYAANGDYRNAIAGIQATVQDAALKPPSLNGQIGGDGFNWRYSLMGFAVRYKTISDGAAKAVAGFFARYGYKINRFINTADKSLADLKVMSKASYWKVQECYLSVALANESEKDTMRGVLEKGVTLWGKPEDIGHTDFLRDNEPLYNISY